MLLLLSDIYKKRENIRSNAKKISPEKKETSINVFFHYNHGHTNDLTQRIVLKEQHLFNANIGEHFPRK